MLKVCLRLVQSWIIIIDYVHVLYIIYGTIILYYNVLYFYTIDVIDLANTVWNARLTQPKERQYVNPVTCLILLYT